MLWKHAQLLLNCFESKGISSLCWGSNNKAELTMRIAYGFKDAETIHSGISPRQNEPAGFPKPGSKRRRQASACRVGAQLQRSGSRLNPPQRDVGKHSEANQK